MAGEAEGQRHDGGPARRPRAPLGVVAVLVVAGLLFSASARASADGALRDDVQDLPGLIQQEAATVEAATERVAALQAEVEALTAAVGDARVGALRERADELAAPAGLRELEGPGVTITLDDAPRDKPVPEGVASDLLVVHQEDVQAVINALWAGGAEAMMLMDQRVISTSAFRCVGSTMRLQGRVYSPPYTITAIGDTGRLLAALDASPDVSIYREYVDAYGLVYDENVQRSITMPAFEGSLELRYARVPGDAA